MIMLYMGEYEVGKAMLDKYGWRENTGRADRCWKNIKRSLHGVNVTTLDTYVTAYNNDKGDDQLSPISTSAVLRAFTISK